ncbi:MAG: DUF3761 domain-containing protein [Xanthobacteraceae bacterium]
MSKTHSFGTRISHTSFDRVTALSGIATLIALFIASPAPAADVKIPSPLPAKCVLPDVDAPLGATARCGDGTYSFSKTRRGTCSSHGGIAQWLGAECK